MTWFDDLCHWLHDYQPLPPGTPASQVDLYVEQPGPTNRPVSRLTPLPQRNPEGPRSEIQKKLKEKMEANERKPLLEWVPPVEFDIEHPENYSREELVEALHMIRSDWKYLNEILNMRAITQSWCGIWEYNQICYNMKMKVLRLVGRGGVYDSWGNYKVTKDMVTPNSAWAASATQPF